MSFDFLAGLVLAHGYAVVFLAVALDCAALPIPGELLLLTIGGLAVQGELASVPGSAAAAGRGAVGAALLAVFSLRAITLVTEELQPGVNEGQAQLGLL